MDKQGTNKMAAMKNALSQMDNILAGTHVNKPLSVKRCGYTDSPPEGLQEEIEAELGRKIILHWQKVEKQEFTNNTGVITDGSKDCGSGAADYYDDAYRRRARTGD